MIVKEFFRFLQVSDSRSIEANKHVIISFIVKGFSVFINLLLVPLILSFLNPSNYGIWLTLTSIIAWFNMLDIGFGNGLRNRLTESLAKRQYKLAREYISTAYFIIFFIFLIIWIVFTIINKHLSWQQILNTNIISESVLSNLALIVVTYFCLQMVVRNINII